MGDILLLKAPEVAKAEEVIFERRLGDMAGYTYYDCTHDIEFLLLDFFEDYFKACMGKKDWRLILSDYAEKLRDLV